MALNFTVFVLGVLESTALAVLAFTLARVTIEWKKIFIIAIVLTSIAFSLRALPITFGVHTIVNIFLLIVYLSYFAKTSLSMSIMAGFISFIVLILSETVSVSALLHIFNISFETMVQNQLMKVLFSIPHPIIILILSYFILHFQKQRRNSFGS